VAIDPAVAAAPEAEREPVAAPDATADPVPIGDLLDEIFVRLAAESPGGVVRRLEAEMISRASARMSGDQTKAAELLGLTRQALKKRLDESKR
jgi:DNA-binding NtrC family response regulator